MDTSAKMQLLFNTKDRQAIDEPPKAIFFRKTE